MEGYFKRSSTTHRPERELYEGSGRPKPPVSPAPGFLAGSSKKPAFFMSCGRITDLFLSI